MKKILTTLALAAVIIFAGCTDLDDVYRRLDKQKEELAHIKALANAVTNKLSVVSYKELPDKSGYELTMSDGSKIILKHGNKGSKGDRGNQGDQGDQGNPGSDANVNLTITETADGIIIEYNGESYILPKLPMMTFTTAAAAGKKITLEIDAAEADRPNIWIDLNNNGTRDDGEAVTKFGSKVNYILGARTVTIYGKVTRLQCTRDQLTTLDVSGNTGLIELDCSHNRLTELDLSSNEKLELLWCHENQISGRQMAALVNSLPNREGKEAGKFRAIAPGSSGEGNTLTVAQAMVATGKNWPVSSHEGAPYTPPGETPPDIHPLSLVGKWNWSKGEVPDGSGGWKSGGGDHAGYWIHFKESDSGEESDNGAFTYTLVVNELYISTWSWDNVTVVSVTDGELVIEIDDSPVAERHHFTRDASTPPIEIPQDEYKMVLTTAKSVGETIRLRIDAAEADRPDVWIDLNNNGEKDDGEAVTKFAVSVEYTLGAQTVTVYGKVTWLNCDENQLTSLNVSNNKELEKLYCRDNHLTELDVSNNKKLVQLSCRDNHLTELDVSNNKELERLYCCNNHLTELDVSNNTALRELNCDRNHLTELDVRNNKKLGWLYCYSNQLTELDVSNNTALQYLYCSDNRLTTLDVSNNKKLGWLYCSDNQLTTLDVSNNTALKVLYCYENKISGDDMTALVNSLPDRNGKEEGEFLVIAKGSDTEQNVITSAQAAVANGRNWPVRDSAENPYTPPGDEPADPMMVLTTNKLVGDDLQLEIDALPADRAGVWIDLNNNGTKDAGEAVNTFGSSSTWKLASRTVTLYGNVTRFDCSHQEVTVLNTGYNPRLTELYCFHNEITGLDLQFNTKLTTLQCGNNRLAELDLWWHDELTRLGCENNRLTRIGITKSRSKLQWLRCYNNRISGGGMTDLVNGLPDRGGKEKGQFIAIAPGSPGEGNSITGTQVATAEGKNWSVLNGSGDPYNPGGDTPPGDVLNPLSLVAEYNVNPAGTGFVTSLTACNVSGYFTFDDAVAKFSDITIGGKKYHLPSFEEWRSIVPESWNYVRFQDTESYNDVSETVTVQGTSITMTSDFRTGVGGVSYALRYKGTDMLSAWRYEYISDGNNTHMKITSRSLKGQTGVTVDDIAKPAFWNTNAENDVIRHFPASGYYWESSLDYVGRDGAFWSSSLYSSIISAWGMYFYSDDAGLGTGVRDFGNCVRLFVSGD